MKKLIPAAIPLLFIVLACGGGGGGGGGGEIPLENACQELQKAYCSLLERCELKFVIEMMFHTECEKADFLCSKDFQEIVESVKAGRMSYDGQKAKACIDYVNKIDCKNIFEIFEEEPPSICQEVFAGLVAENGSCYDEDECQSGLYCDLANCPGTCKHRAGQNASCEQAPCLEELACNSQNICVPRASAGQSCEEIDCQEGLICDNSISPRKCIEPGDEGAACQKAEQCKSGLRCINQKCTGPADAGKTCILQDFEDFPLACKTGYYCDADLIAQETEGTCRPKKGQGEECLLFFECRPDLLCIGVQYDEKTGSITKGKCLPPLSAGQSCNPALGAEGVPECRYDLWCSAETAKCEALPTEGGVCAAEGQPQCISQDLYCDVPEGQQTGTCRKRKAEGEPCKYDFECASDYCFENTCRLAESCTP